MMSAAATPSEAVTGTPDDAPVEPFVDAPEVTEQACADGVGVGLRLVRQHRF